ncbi:hypothetical protein LCGC14_2691930, partial [marine sediment metagenome]
MTSNKSIDDELKLQIGERLKQLIKANGEQYRVIADEYDLPMSTINTWFAGLYYPQMQFLIKLAARYKVSLDWILTGQESLLPKDQR